MMKGKFICFEGIDGSGKSTTAAQLFEQRREKNLVTFLDKKDISQIRSPFVRHQLENIKASLWEQHTEDNILEIGEYHWLMLLSAWFSAIAESHIKPTIDSGVDVIVDNWIYKFQVRFSLKKQYTPAFVESIFKPILKPDQVVLLDIDPEIAFSRRGEVAIKPSEAGRCDGETGDIKNGFVHYQSKVRALLLDWSEQQHWQVLNSGVLTSKEIVTSVDRQLFQDDNLLKSK